VVGKIKYCLDVWKRFTNDPWILQSVEGYILEFDTKPVQFSVPNEIIFNTAEMEIIDQEVAELLNKGAIVPSHWEDGQFVSNIFVVKKPNGKYRPIINLKQLNKFVHYEHFKQEHFKVVLDLIQENDFFCSVDLQDAYFSVPIHEDYQKYLKFSWRGNIFMFICLPFGYSGAPRVFTKLLKPVYAWIRSQGIRCSYYIDDSLNMNKDRMVCAENSQLICNTLTSLGYTVNLKKSVLVPSQEIVFFGFILDSVQFMVFLTDEKIQKILLKAKQLTALKIVVVRELASFIGLLVNAFYAVLEAPLHYRELERCKVSGLGIDNNYDNFVTLSSGAVSELHWWIKNVEYKNGKHIRPKSIDYTFQSDASLLGWGCFDTSSHQFANGRWSRKEALNPINYLELLAIFWGLQSLYKNVTNCHIKVFSDNVSAVVYINEMGGMASVAMDNLAGRIWDWCLERSIFLSASYLKGSENFQADFYSRNFSHSTEWMLKREIFKRICSEFFIPDIDMFASRLNFQIDRYVSWLPEPGSYRTDAFSFSWTDYKPYLFPPFALIGRVINKLVQDKVQRAVLVLPFWRSQFWFPLVLDLLISIPVRLPRHKDLLTMPHDKSLHPLGKSLRMIAVELSTDTSKIKAFIRQLSGSSLTHGKRVLRNSMIWPGESGIFGVKGKVKIPLKQLRLR
jgi:hypothetical protein